MEKLADKGTGNYAYLDSLFEAQARAGEDAGRAPRSRDGREGT
jgi:hypothetical protein